MLVFLCPRDLYCFNVIIILKIKTTKQSFIDKFLHGGVYIGMEIFDLQQFSGAGDAGHMAQLQH